MKIRKFLLGALCLAGLWGGAAGAAEVMYNGIGFIQGSQSLMDSFSVSGPGTLTVTLTNIDWPQELASLNMVVSTANGMLGPEMGAGTESFDIKSGGTIFAQWFGTAQGPLDVGVYGMKIMFKAADETAVPLPASAALLVSGLMMLVWQRRHRTRFELLPDARA